MKDIKEQFVFDKKEQFVILRCMYHAFDLTITYYLILQVVKIESAPKRKGNRIKKFGGMKKNLFHVKHLHMNGMNKMMACTGNDRKSILSQH